MDFLNDINTSVIRTKYITNNPDDADGKIVNGIWFDESARRVMVSRNLDAVNPTWCQVLTTCDIPQTFHYYHNYNYNYNYLYRYWCYANLDVTYESIDTYEPAVGDIPPYDYVLHRTEYLPSHEIISDDISVTYTYHYIKSADIIRPTYSKVSSILVPYDRVDYEMSSEKSGEHFDASYEAYKYYTLDFTPTQVLTIPYETTYKIKNYVGIKSEFITEIFPEARLTETVYTEVNLPCTTEVDPTWDYVTYKPDRYFTETETTTNNVIVSTEINIPNYVQAEGIYSYEPATGNMVFSYEITEDIYSESEKIADKTFPSGTYTTYRYTSVENPYTALTGSLTSETDVECSVRAFTEIENQRLTQKGTFDDYEYRETEIADSYVKATGTLTETNVLVEIEPEEKDKYYEKKDSFDKSTEVDVPISELPISDLTEWVVPAPGLNTITISGMDDHAPSIECSITITYSELYYLIGAIEKTFKVVDDSIEDSISVSLLYSYESYAHVGKITGYADSIAVSLPDDYYIKKASAETKTYYEKTDTPYSREVTVSFTGTQYKSTEITTTVKGVKVEIPYNSNTYTLKDGSSPLDNVVYTNPSTIISEGEVIIKNFTEKTIKSSKDDVTINVTKPFADLDDEYFTKSTGQIGPYYELSGEEKRSVEIPYTYSEIKVTMKSEEGIETEKISIPTGYYKPIADMAGVQLYKLGTPPERDVKKSVTIDKYLNYNIESAEFSETEIDISIEVNLGTEENYFYKVPKGSVFPETLYHSPTLSETEGHVYVDENINYYMVSSEYTDFIDFVSSIEEYYIFADTEIIKTAYEIEQEEVELVTLTEISEFCEFIEYTEIITVIQPIPPDFYVKKGTSEIISNVEIVYDSCEYPSPGEFSSEHIFVPYASE